MTISTDLTDTGLLAQLQQLVGAENVSREQEQLELFSQDIYSRAPELAAMIVAPANTEELAACVAAATSAGHAVIARGAGMSYTSGYNPTQSGTVMFDMRRMNKIVTIDEENMFVTVEAGCTWVDLYKALKEKGLRTPFYGPLSGILSTIGGGLSMNNAFLGGGTFGPVSDSVICLTVVLADGTIVETGSASTKTSLPFMRQYGPDLAGLFLGDCGALGLKANATLRLIQVPKAEGYASFAFKQRDDAANAISSFSRAGIGTELFGFDPKLQKVRLKRAGIANDIKALGSVIKKQGNLFGGMKEAAKIALAGRDFVQEDDYSIHICVEGRSQAAVEADLAEARQIAEACNGREVENTIPKVMRADPFQPLSNMIGAEGERWAPVHGYVSHSNAKKVWKAIDDHFDEMQEEFEALGISNGHLLTSLSTNCFLLEPIYYWPHALDKIHLQTVPKETLSKIKGFPENEAATAVVAKSRKRVAEIFYEHGATHFQIGKTYLYREGRKEAPWNLLDQIKSVVDPNRKINPGVLGLD